MSQIASDAKISSAMSNLGMTAPLPNLDDSQVLKAILVAMGNITGGGGGGSGTVTSVGFTGGLISVATPTTNPALTVAGTSGGIPYFSSASTWASSGVLALNSLIIGGGSGAAPLAITTGTGVLTALGIAASTFGGFVTNGGALGTPISGVLTNCTGLPISTGVSGLGTGVATTLATNLSITGGGIIGLGGFTLTVPATGTAALLGTANVFTTLQTITQANANTGVLASTGYSLTGSNATNLIDLAGIWNTSGTPTAFKLNITNTASNVASKLIDLQVGGVSAMSLTAVAQPVMTIGNASFHTLDIGGIGIIKCNYGGGERGRITFAENAYNIQMMAGTTGDYGVVITNSSLNGGYLSSDIRTNTTVGVFKIEPNPRQSAGAYTGSGHTLLLKGGQAQTTSTGSSGGLVSIIGGAAGGSGNNNGGNIELSGGTSTGSGAIGCIKFGLATSQLMGWWNATPVAQPAHIADPSGGAVVDAEARTAINSILAWQATLGLTAAS